MIANNLLLEARSPLSMNRINWAMKFDAGRPLSVQLEEISTDGSGRYFIEPNSTWGWDSTSLLGTFFVNRSGHIHGRVIPAVGSSMAVPLIIPGLVSHGTNFSSNSDLTGFGLVDYGSDWAEAAQYLGGEFCASTIPTASWRADIEAATVPADHSKSPVCGHIKDEWKAGAAAFDEQVEAVETVSPAAIKQVEVNLSDYFDPLDLEWDQTDFKAAEAARAFGDAFHADH